MKKSLTKTLGIVLVLTMLLSIVPVSVFADTVKSTETVGPVVYYTEDGLRTAVKTVTIDGVNYYDCSDGKAVNIDTNYLYNLLSKPVDYRDAANNQSNITILTEWAEIASAIFENGGKYTSSHSYSDCYGDNHSSNSDEKCNVSELLSTTTAKSKGERKKDNYGSSGLSVIGSFSALRQKMCDDIAYRINRKTCEGSDILGQGNNCPDALPALADSTPRDIIYNMVTSITREGSTAKYQYNSYCVAFYDFDLMILADENLEYVTGAEAYKDCENPVEAAANAGVAGFNYVMDSQQTVIDSCINDSVIDVSANVTLDSSQNQSVMTSVQNSETYTYGQMIGGELGFRLFKLDAKGQLQFTFNEAYQSVHTNEATQTVNLGSSYTTNTTVPAQTVSYIKQDQGNSSITIPYQTPVALTFKVAIFSMSGDVYADSGLTLAFSTAGYDQSNFSTFFGGSTTESGIYAYDSLSKKMANASLNGWDSTYGNNHFFYKKHDGGSNPTDTSNMDLNWNAINTTFKSNTGSTREIKDVASRVPMLPAGTTITINGESKSAEIYDPLPLYLPTTLRVIDNTKQNLIMYKGGRFYLNTVSIGCFNKNNVPYYPFKATDGHWEVCEGSEDIIEYEDSTFSVIAKNTGMGYLRWVLNDDVTYTAEHESGTVTSKDLNPVTIAFTVRDNPLQNTYTVKAPEKFTGTAGDTPVNFNNLLDVVDESNNIADYALKWEVACDEGHNDCFTLTDDNMVTFNSTHPLKVRARVNPESVNEYLTEWVEIIPREEREVVSASMDEIHLEDITLVIRYLRTHTELNNAKFDISSFVTFYDQYGDKWNGEAPEIEIEADNTNGAYIDDSQILTLSNKGKFNVTVKSPGLADPVIGTLSFNVDADIQHEIGDTDGDNYRTIKDATLIQKHLAQLISEDNLIIDNADVNGDGKITITDATTIQKYLAAIIKD